MREDAVEVLLERRVGAREAAAHVVRRRADAAAELAEELEERDEAEDLELAVRRHLVPERGRRLRRVVTGDVERELEAVRVEAVAHLCGNEPVR